MDDSADLVNRLHTRRTGLLADVVRAPRRRPPGSSGCAPWPLPGSCYPVLGVNRALTPSAPLRQPLRDRPNASTASCATNVLIAGKQVVIGG